MQGYSYKSWWSLHQQRWGDESRGKSSTAKKRGCNASRSGTDKEGMTQKTVFVSGAGRGIGRDIAERFAQEGYLVGAYTRSGHFEWGQNDPNVVQGKMDSSDPEDYKRAIEDFMKHTDGRLDILINNAGVAVIGEFENQKFEDEKQLFEVNVMGYINGIHAALPYLKNTPGAQIVNISSAASFVGTPDLAVYSAAKFAIRGLTEALDIEFMKYGIRIIDVNPLFVKTDMVEKELEKGYTIPILKTLGLKLTASDVTDVVWTATRPEKQKSTRLHWAVGKQARILSHQHFMPNAVPRALTRAMAKRNAKKGQ